MPSPQFNFTARDFTSNLESLEQFVRTKEPEKWTSFFDGDLGSVLLESIAYNYTLLAFTADRQALECFLDTLQLRESALHFASLTSYQIRRSTSATISVFATASASPASGERFVVRKGTLIRDKLGQPWEVAEETFLEEGEISPTVEILKYGDIIGKVPSTEAVSEVKALVKLEPGSSIAVLVDENGERFSSELNFTPRVGAGQILVLGNEHTGGGAFTSSPSPGKDEYAIIESSKYDYDVYDNSILYLDRVWSGDATWEGKWTIQSRSIVLVQGETKVDRETAPTDLDDRKDFSFTGLFYPVVMGALDPSTPSGSTRLTGVSNSGVEVFVNGIKWTETSSLLFEAPDSQTYQVSFDERDRFTITFGNGVFGAVVPEDAVIEAHYRVGGGSSGNIPQGTIDTQILIGDTFSSSNEGANLYLTNAYTVGTGGQSRESLTDIKKNITAHVRSNDRAVSSSDYSYLASNFSDPIAGSVKLAKGTRHKNLVPREQNIVWVYTWVEGTSGQLTAPSLTLKQRLKAYLDERKMINDEVVIVDGDLTPQPIELRYCFDAGADRTQTKQKVQSAVNNVFTQLLPGDALRLSRLYEAVESVSEVKFGKFVWPNKDIIPTNEFELLNNTMQFPATTTLANPATAGGITVQVTEPAIFFVGGYISLYETGKEPSTAKVLGISGDTLTLQANQSLISGYSLSAVVTNSAYLPYDWQFEQPVDIFITYAIGDTTSSLVTQTIKRKMQKYFSETLRPEEVLSRTTLRLLVQSTQNVSESDVRLKSVDGTTEQIVPSNSEKIVLGTLSINNEVL